MKIEIEIGEVNAIDKINTQKNLQALVDRLRPSGVSKLMAMYSGAKKVMVEMFFKSNGI